MSIGSKSLKIKGFLTSVAAVDLAQVSLSPIICLNVF